MQKLGHGRITPLLPTVDPDNQSNHRQYDQGYADKLVEMEEIEGKNTKNCCQAVENIADLSGIETCHTQTIMQMCRIIVPGTLTIPEAINNNYCNIHNWQSHDHQC
jgi:hypothetical protein